MDTIFINEIPTQAIIGINSFERLLPQKIIISIELQTDIRQLAQDENLEMGINYDEVCQFIDTFVQQSTYHLIEALAENLAKEIIATFNTPQIKLTVKKLGALKKTQHVGIVIVRNKSDY